jgi:hypothetical protein
MKQPVPLQYDNNYHIYNQGINGKNLFREKNDFGRNNNKFLLNRDILLHKMPQ